MLLLHDLMLLFLLGVPVRPPCVKVLSGSACPFFLFFSPGPVLVIGIAFLRYVDANGPIISMVEHTLRRPNPRRALTVTPTSSQGVPRTLGSRGWTCYTTQSVHRQSSNRRRCKPGTDFEPKGLRPVHVTRVIWDCHPPTCPNLECCGSLQ